MQDIMYLGAGPGDEECAQVGSPDYYPRAKAECIRYIALLRKMFGAEPEGARLVTKSNAHDYGSYLEVVVKYDFDNEAATDYAFKVEKGLPATWEG